MRRLALLLAMVTALSLAAAGPAPASGPGSGQILWFPAAGCAFSIDTATAPFGGFPLDLAFIGGTSFADPNVGFVCTGSVAFMALPINPPLTVTGLTCIITGDEFTTYPTGTLTSSGTAIFYRNGTARLICPPSPRS